MNYKQKKKNKDKRFLFLLVVIFLFSFLLIIRVFSIAVLDHQFYSSLAKGQRSVFKQLIPERGKIFIQEKTNEEKKIYPLAVNQKLYLAYAVPALINKPEETAKKLAALLKIKEEELIPLLSKKNDPYEPLKHYLDEKKVQEIKALKLEGIDFLEETIRYYPEKNIASHLTGFVGFDGNKQAGRYGLEGYFNEELSGQKGFLGTERGAGGGWIITGGRQFKKAVDGFDLVLTIDRSLQFTACDRLSKGVSKYAAESGTVIIMDPKSGAILAMCSYPDFDPNKYSEVKDINIFNNPAIFTPYEPGSIFKPITMAAAIDSDKVKPNTVYYDTGEIKMEGFTIKNAANKKYGTQDMSDVLRKSINTGAIYAVRQLDQGVFKKYVEDFGFGSLSGIELDTETSGDIGSLDKKGEIYTATASFGQGITVTPLQMVTAYGTIANQGKLVKPYLIEEIIKPNKETIKTQIKEIKQVISPRAAALLSGMLVSVLREGHSTLANVSGYYLAGKTGTAQIPSPRGGYGHETIHTFVGFGPVDDPKFVMMVKLDKVKNVPYADSSAAPVFSQIADFMLKYYKIKPEEKLIK